MGLNERLRPPAEQKPKNNFEPFVNPEHNPNNLLVNGYSGNYAQNMELDRKGIETVLKIVHLNGKVFFSSMPKSRDRSLEGVNEDGSVEVKRTPMLEDEVQGLEDEENPFYRTVPVAEGWKIEINDERMMEELQKKGLTGKKLQGKFVQGFDSIFKTAVFECIRREKLSSVKDNFFKVKRNFLILNLGSQSIVWAIGVDGGMNPLQAAIIPVSSWMLANVFLNIFTSFQKRDIEDLEVSIGMIYPKVNRPSFYAARQIDHLWEYLLPPLEVDKVARTLILLSLPGKTLVRERK